VASLEKRNGSWRVVFRYKGEKRHYTIGEVTPAEAHVYKATTEELLRLLNRNLLNVPQGCIIEKFMLHRGHPPEDVCRPAAGGASANITLAELREGYRKAQEGKLEQTTLDVTAQHFAHFLRLLGGASELALMTRGDVQGYVDTRSREWIDPERYRRERRKKATEKPKRKYVRKNAPAKPAEVAERPKRHPSPATIRREVATLRIAWNWARRNAGLAEEFPGQALDYAKTEEALPFMNWAEAERRVAAGDDAEKVWECLYLTPAEVGELLEYVRSQPLRPWVYPMVFLAAHTGARRSEIVRALPSDVDLDGGVFTVREKKKGKRRLTTRRVPLTPALKEALAIWAARRADGRTFFCKDDGEAVTPREAQNYLRRALAPSKWRVLKGWHTLRHSFCSALASKGVDQRVIDEMMGHSTEQQRRRYRHLYPDVQRKAVADVFG
jgi:integrase